MAIFENPQILLLTAAIICCLVWTRRKRRSAVPTNWPLVGMLPGILRNLRRIHSYVTEILTECGGTFEFKGPWFCSMDMVITCDPANIHHIFSKNFPNYPKGPEFRKIFEILGDGIFNADFQLWELHRRTTHSFFTHSNFYSSLEGAVWHKVETGLLPVLELYCEGGIGLDLQDVFQRFTFDSICKLVLDYDPQSLSVDLPYIPCEKAFNDAMEALLHRHALPEAVWKLQKWLGIGKEGKLKRAWKSFDEFIYKCISLSEQNDSGVYCLMANFRKAYEEKNNGSSRESTRQFLRDTALNLMLAGRDTTSTCLTWLFWLLSSNPWAVIKIREEIEAQLHVNKWRRFGVEETRRLIYLHGALCESLRLFPPVAMEHKAPIRPEVLPSGNHVLPSTKMLVSFYSTGRMEVVWGKDCLEFRPERWITPRGEVKHEPSYKFPAFNAGPRTCLGKEMAFIQMKMVAAFLIFHYDVKPVEGHPVEVRDSIILQAKQGLMVRLSKRDIVV